jgi:hypothetical protein
MSAEFNDQSNADETEVPSSPSAEFKPSGNFPLTERQKAIARGDDPDAIPTEESTGDEVQLEDETTPDAGTVDTQSASWITDGDRAKAKAYGMEPEDLDAYESREQFGSALRAIDRAYSRLPKPETQAEPAPKVEAKEPEYIDELYVDGKVNIEYLRRHKDEVEGSEFLLAQAEHTALLEKEVADLKASVSQREQESQQEQAHRELAAFNREVDRFRPDVYGSSVDANGQPVPLKPEDADRRYKLLGACAAYTDYIHSVQQAHGMSPSTPALSEVLKQAEFIAFPEEATSRAKAEAVKEREAELKRVAKQAARVRPVATTASVTAAHRGAPPEDPYSTTAIMRTPQIQAVLDRINSGANH